MSPYPAGLLLGALVVLTVAATPLEDAAGCSAGVGTNAVVDDAGSSELSLLQTELVLQKRSKPKTKTVEIQGGGVLDAEKREALEQAMEAVLEDAEQKKAVAVTTTSYVKPDNAAEASGVKSNGAGDLAAFLTALASNVVMGFGCVCVFMVLRNWFPLTFSNNLKSNTPALSEIPSGLWGWARASWAVDTKDAMDNVGLDHAMLLEFMNLGMKIMALIGVPMLCIMGPVHYLFGGHAAGDDHLSYLSFGNVVNGSNLYWIHAFIVWGVVFAVQTSIYNAQKKFLALRFQWLRELPNPRANTVLVEGIPEDCQSDEQLNVFFAKMFGPDQVVSSYVVKKAPELEAAWSAMQVKERQRGSIEFKLQQTNAAGGDQDGDREALRILEGEIEDLGKKIKSEQAAVKEKSSTLGEEGCNTSSGFVSFASKSTATLALSAQFGKDADEWEVSVPPEPRCVLWKDLQQSATSRSGLTLLGYLLTAGLYMAYLPLVINITQIAVKINMGPLQPLWAGLAPTMGLQIMVAFLPTFLILIFRFCFTLKDDAWAQQMLQNWYFVFQVVFVIMVTAIGGSMVEFVDTLAEKPLEIFSLLAKTMPYATHFYMNFLVLQWVSHTMVLMRYVPLAKFFVFRKLYDEEVARQMSEPEDQDYYGIGSRSARMTINMCIGVIYGTLSPPINLLTFIEFLICRVTYGYLIPFAETKKPDLGGVFWVQQLRHLFFGNIIYCIVMVGVLLGRASTNGPCMIAAPSLVYVFWSMQKFERSFLWEKLPFKELVSLGDAKQGEAKQKPDVGEYVQPWLG